MNPKHLTRQLLAGVLAGLLVVALLQGCSENPTPPSFENPFDADREASANPFDLEAIQNEASVILSWTMLDGFGFVTYIVQHRVDGGPWNEIATLEAEVGPAQFIFDGASPTAVNSFRVVAENGFGDRTSTNPLVPVSVNMPPVIVNETGIYAVASRHQNLVVLAGVGDTVQVSLDGNFAAGVRAVPRDPSGETPFDEIDLGQAQPGTTIAVYARTLSEVGGTVVPSARGQRGFTIAPAPAITLVRGGSAIASPLVDLTIANGGVGIDSMRFASSVEGLDEAPWRPGAAVAEDVPVADTVQSQTIHAQYARDFGFTATTTLTVQASDLSGADFSFPDLDQNRITEDPALRLRHAAVATDVRVSQFPDFHDTSWVPFPADSITVLTLVEQPDQSLYPVFAQYRNHWFQSTVRTDFVILGPAEIRVAFANPLQGQIVRGGSTLEVIGTAETFDATVPIDSVQVHLGDGWQRATGTENWEIAWEVPLLEEDTTWQLGVLARAGQYTGYGWISVTISQLAVAITAPADAAEIIRGSTVNVTGTAAPYAAGAPLDSVVVAVLDERLAATGLASWSVAWEVPEAAPEFIDLTAWAYAGGDSVSRRIQVTAVDPER
jgi:hypothetical protein